MPAIVRGGRRQAAQPSKGAGKPAPKGAARGGGRKSNASHSRIGSVPMSNELIGWLAFGGLATLMSVVLLTGGRAEMLKTSVANFVDGRIAAVGVNLQKMRLVGVSEAASPDIKKALTFERGQPIALMDLEKVRQDVEAVGWVKSAVVRRQFPDGLIITVTERPRLAVWQHNNKVVVIDDKGQIIPEANAHTFTDLPLIVGEGANEQAAQVLELLRARPELLTRTEALIRVNTRRWDVRLKNGALIKLPALNEDEALNRLDALIVQKRILDQGFAVIDLLDPNTLVVVPLHTGNAQG
ncbi:MAG: cell division protein FtsQ/DivIB [Asticcacaulis sp.]